MERILGGEILRQPVEDDVSEGSEGTGGNEGIANPFFVGALVPPPATSEKKGEIQ